MRLWPSGFFYPAATRCLTGPSGCKLFGRGYQIPAAEGLNITNGKNLAWPPLQSLAVKKKKLFLVQMLGGEKLLKFVEKCR